MNLIVSIISMWGSHERLDSMKMPRYLWLETMSIGWGKVGWRGGGLEHRAEKKRA